MFFRPSLRNYASLRIRGPSLGIATLFLAGSAILFVSEKADTATRTEAPQNANKTKETSDGVSSGPEELFYGECLNRQVCRPNRPYPAWNYDWDGRHERAGNEGEGKTRHILLIRHGQYEQGFREDHRRVLTPLGRRQAEYTGQRLAKMVATNRTIASDEGKDIDTLAGPCRIKAIHVSDMARAKETASIIASQLDPAFFSLTNSLTDPDPLLNEALPSPIIPKRPDVGTIEEQAKEIDANHDRIEIAFRKYIHRADSCEGKKDDNSPEHEFELIVGHGNVIRYFVFRALQLPPEAWLRLSLFNCSITYLVIQPDGRVTVRLVGDTGHIPYEETSFSGR